MVSIVRENGLIPARVKGHQSIDMAALLRQGLVAPTQNSGTGAPETEQEISDRLYGHVRRLTEGRAKELQNDPIQRQIIQQLRGVMRGETTPYNESSLNALQGQQAHGAATAQAAQMETLRQQLGASGGSIYDPGYQSAMRESDATRQGQNMDYAGQLRAMAALENFNAQQNATRSLAGVNQAQNAQINQLNLAGAGYRAGRFQEQQTPGVLMPQYNPQMQQAAPKSGETDTGWTPPKQPQGFTASGTGYPGQSQQQQPQTPANNSNLAGPPAPSGVQAFGPMFSNPQTQQQPSNAIGGFSQPVDEMAILRGLMTGQRGPQRF